MQVNQGDLVIEIGGEGKVKAVHSDAFDLAFLGSKQVRRQTEIKFNEDTQKWDIIYIDDEGAYHPHEAVSGFDGYEEARAFEVDWVNKCRLYSIPPSHHIGFAYAQWLRTGDKHDCFTLPDGSCISDHCMHVPAK